MASYSFTGYGETFEDVGIIYRVEIDGADLGPIRPRETRCFELLPGTHSLRLTFLQLRRSRRVSVPIIEGEVKDFTCRTSYWGVAQIIEPDGTSRFPLRPTAPLCRLLLGTPHCELEIERPVSPHGTPVLF